MKYFHFVLTAGLVLGLGGNFVLDYVEQENSVKKEELDRVDLALVEQLNANKTRIDSIEAGLVTAGQRLDLVTSVGQVNNENAWVVADAIQLDVEVPSEIVTALAALEASLDNDGVLYPKDICPDIAGVDQEGENFDGCPASAKADADKDEVADIRDACPDTPDGDDSKTANVKEKTRVVDEATNRGWKSEIFTNVDDGCSDLNGDGVADKFDADGDGVRDGTVDKCPGTAAGSTHNAKGCAALQVVDTCAVWDGAKSTTVAGGASGTAVGKCAGADDPEALLSFAWTKEKDGSYKYETGIPYVAPAAVVVAEPVPPAKNTVPTGGPPPPQARP